MTAGTTAEPFTVEALQDDGRARFVCCPAWCKGHNFEPVPPDYEDDDAQSVPIGYEGMHILGTDDIAGDGMFGELPPGSGVGDVLWPHRSTDAVFDDSGASCHFHMERLDVARGEASVAAKPARLVTVASLNFGEKNDEGKTLYPANLLGHMLITLSKMDDQRLAEFFRVLAKSANT